MKNAQGFWGETAEYLEQRKYASASMIHFYAGKGNLFWKIRSLRVEHTHMRTQIIIPI